MMQRSRIADVLKGIAVLLMIQVHVLELFAIPQVFFSEKGSFLLFLGGPLVAPIFAIVFGYFVAISKRTQKQLVVRGIKIFLLGLGLNIVLNFNLFLHVYKETISVNVWQYVFGVDFLLFAGLAIVLIALLREILRKSVFITIGVSLLTAFLGHFLLEFVPENTSWVYVSSFFYGSSHWSYFPIFPWVSYPLLGMAFFQIKDKIQWNNFLNLKGYLLSAILFALFLIFTISYAISVAANLPEYYRHGVVFFIWTAVFLLFYSVLLHGVERLIGQTLLFRYIKWLGKNVTAVYVFQWILIGNIGTEIYKTITSPMILILSFVGVLAVSSLLTLLYTKLRLSLRA